MKNSDNQTAIVILIIVAALVLFGFAGFGGYGMMGRGYGGYGSNLMCGMMGGIWCYWPSFGFVIQILITIALVLFIFWLYRQLNGGKR